jgi:hypothetical protein
MKSNLPQANLPQNAHRAQSQFTGNILSFVTFVTSVVNFENADRQERRG